MLRPLPTRTAHGFARRVVDEPALLNLLGCPYVYAVSDGLAVKLGKSLSHPSLRLRELQTGNPRRLILVAWTLHTTEREVHRRMRGARLAGEWFVIGPALLQEIRGWDWLDLRQYRLLDR